MNTLIIALAGQRKKIGIVATLLTAGAIAGWAMSATVAKITASAEDPSPFEIMRRNDTNLPLEEFKLSLIGSYAVTGTDAGGEPYISTGVLDIAFAPSGALELAWDNGKSVGVGQIVGNVLAVASSTRGRIVILMMNINPDGTLSGKSLRRTDPGSKGTETWKKA
jgi:hypothetical protein